MISAGNASCWVDHTDYLKPDLEASTIAERSLELDMFDEDTTPTSAATHTATDMTPTATPTGATKQGAAAEDDTDDDWTAEPESPSSFIAKVGSDDPFARPHQEPHTKQSVNGMSNNPFADPNLDTSFVAKRRDV